MSDTPTTFDCVACLEAQHGNPININGDLLCEACVTASIIPQFHDALRSETQFPVRYRGTAIDIGTVHQFFSEEFVDEWEEMERERAIPLQDRLYCATPDCGRFLGMRHLHDAATQCLSCGGQTRANCRASTTHDQQHECQGTEQVDPFEGLQRGRDWQRCPGCSTAVQLSEACNHMTCVVPSCNTHFCWLCGEEASGDSDHWDYGMPCPRYGQPSAANLAVAPAPLDLNDDDDIQIAALLQEGLAAARNDLARQMVDHAPDEIRARHADLLILAEVNDDILERIGAALENPGDAAAGPGLVRLGTMVSVLMSSLDVYALHLYPEQNRMARLANINRVHDRLMFAGVVEAEEYPEVIRIRDAYETARARQI